MKESSLELVKTRAIPGILIFDKDCRLVFSNREAFSCLPGLRRGTFASDLNGLCRQVGDRPALRGRQSDRARCRIIDDAGGVPWALRAFPVSKMLPKRKRGYVLVLVERLVDRHLVHIDFRQIMDAFGLTRRETGVLRLIGEGLSNHEIARRLFICEYTVKDHVKKIMRKMNLKSRSEIIVSLLHPRS